MIKRDLRMPSGAFTGNYYIVGLISGLAIQSDSTMEKANASVKILNNQNARCRHTERYVILVDTQTEKKNESLYCQREPL